MKSPNEGEEFHLKDKKEFLWELEFNPYNLKLLVKSYRTSKVKLCGVNIDCGHFRINIGPLNQNTFYVPKPKHEALEYLGLNPHAINQLITEFLKSSIKRDGLEVLIDDVRIMIGPQRKGTLKIR